MYTMYCFASIVEHWLKHLQIYVIHTTEQQVPMYTFGYPNPELYIIFDSYTNCQCVSISKNLSGFSRKSIFTGSGLFIKKIPGSGFLSTPWSALIVLYFPQEVMFIILLQEVYYYFLFTLFLLS